MIVFETAPSPPVRAGEAEIAGRRIAGRLSPYGGEAGPGAFRFDPVERRFLFRKAEATVAVGPADPEAWREASSRLPAGPVLVGPCAGAEEVRGAFRAAAEGALAAGRAVYLLDPEPAGLPESGGNSVVVLCTWRPGRGPVLPALVTARSAGLSCAAFFPLIPGWTAEPPVLEALIARAATAGAVSATALVPLLDGEARRAMVEVRSAVEPEAADRFFELIHHGDWSSRLADRLGEVRAACVGHGLASVPPRPVGRGEPAGNSAAAACLEDRAEQEKDEHHAAMLHAAVRWIDESGRDLAAVAREGNFSKVFPFGPELAVAAEAALCGQR